MQKPDFHDPRFRNDAHDGDQNFPKYAALSQGSQIAYNMDTAPYIQQLSKDSPVQVVFQDPSRKPENINWCRGSIDFFVEDHYYTARCSPLYALTVARYLNHRKGLV